jgi:Zn-dependent M28 family amino/carboxypeptidase
MTVRYWLSRGPVLVLLGLLALIGERVRAANEIVEARMRKDIFFLASDECEGRGVTTKGINIAADYIANEFKKAGLKPGGPDGSYFQPFTIGGGARLANPNTLALSGPLGQAIELKLGQHFGVLGLSAAGKVSAPIVFAGYGIVTDKGIVYDDYKDLDVKGKVVLLIRKTPRTGNEQVPFAGNESAYHAAFITKAANAEKHHAAAIIIVNDRDTANDVDRLMDFRETAFEFTKVPTINLRRSVADRLLQSTLGTTLCELEQDVDRDLKPRSAPLTGWTASLEVNVNRTRTAVKNVIGVLEGSGPLAQETVVIGAHYDHLGYGGFGSLAGRGAKPAIHHGADDNASGTTSVMELARRFAQRPSDNRRRLVFIAFSGEESGLLGSRHYCNKEPLFPLDKTVAMVNLDMVGRLRKDDKTNKDKVLVEGSGSAKTFDALLDRLSEKYEFQFSKKASGTGPSDHDSFYRKGVPVIFYWTGYHPDYHRPSDTADKINIPGMAKIADLAEDTTDYLARVPERPQYISVPAPHLNSGNQVVRGGGPRLGIMPNYDDDKEGVLLDGVSEDNPAAKAGLKVGDRIIEIAGKPVKNVESYMAIMAGQKKGDKIDVTILRDGKKTTVKVALE